MKRKWTNETAKKYMDKVEKGKEPMRTKIFKCKRLFKKS